MIALLFAVILAWDWNTESNLEGYRVYCRGDTMLPLASLDVGKANQWNADQFLRSQPAGSKLFFTVKAYNTENVEGEPSNEVTYLVPDSPVPTPTPAPIPAHTHSWEEITGKPETYPNQPHTHPTAPGETGVGQ